jgi:hypothetical protein
MKNKRVLISGASIAGPALAYWLSRYGFEPTVVERAPALRPGGYAVDFRGASMRVLERMGLLGEVQRRQTRIGAITIVDGEGRKVASMPDGFTSGELEVLRGDLAEIFYDATRERAEYIFDDSIEQMEQSDGGVDVVFQRGGRRRFDLVVGADGLHSRVRALAFGEERKFVRHLGYYVSIFTVPNYLQLDGSGVYYGTLGKKVGVFSGGRWARGQGVVLFCDGAAGVRPPQCCGAEGDPARAVCGGGMGVGAADGADGRGTGLLFRLREPGEDGPMVCGAGGFGRGRGLLWLAAFRNGDGHGGGGRVCAGRRAGGGGRGLRGGVCRI